MIKKIVILINLVCLSGCVFVGFDKGLNYEEVIGYRFEYDKETRGTTVYKNNKEVYIIFYSNSCGNYGLFGVVIPFIPMWENYKCNQEAAIHVSEANNVYVKHNDKIYKPSNISKIKTYTFPIPIKSLSDGAILVVEKDGEIFEIPFRYQHTFDFQIWGK